MSCRGQPADVQQAAHWDFGKHLSLTRPLHEAQKCWVQESQVCSFHGDISQPQRRAVKMLHGLAANFQIFWPSWAMSGQCWNLHSYTRLAFLASSSLSSAWQGRWPKSSGCKEASPKCFQSDRSQYFKNLQPFLASSF